KGAPNVLLIMTDDQGYGITSTFGGVIPTPAMDRLAKAGVRYTQFHSTALCSPTRAALITGRNLHSARTGLRQRHPEEQSHHWHHPEGQWRRDLVVRQDPQHADLPVQPGRPVRSM